MVKISSLHASESVVPIEVTNAIPNAYAAAKIS